MMNKTQVPGTPFLRNAWYMAAWSDEIRDDLFSRRLLGERIVFYRVEGGKIAALTDRCPHRFLPLSMGKRKDNTIQCGYHGLVFDTGGRCVHNPFADKPPIGANVRAWPVGERDGIVWLWAGDTDKCDAATIPDFSNIRCPTGKPLIKGYTYSQSQYEYITDNLMDLSHLEFVHRGTFAADDLLFSGKHSLVHDGDALITDWSMTDSSTPPWFWWKFPKEQRTDQWLTMRWNAPAIMHLQIGLTATGEGREDGFIVHQGHFITPETESTSHYFWATSRFDMDASGEADAQVLARQLKAFEGEDKPVIEAAYANTDGKDFWELKPAFLGVDTGPTSVRRMLQKMVADENRIDIH